MRHDSIEHDTDSSGPRRRGSRRSIALIAAAAHTAGNLVKVGYTVPTDVDHLYLKFPAGSPPAYLHCAAVTTCTTIEYKSGTRAHIESLGYHIVADFGDQFSDLEGGFTDQTFKLPNPMYFLP